MTTLFLDTESSNSPTNHELREYDWFMAAKYYELEEAFDGEYSAASGGPRDRLHRAVNII